MATTHKTVKTGGGGDYTTITAAIASTSSGSSGDYSTITILDSATYTETLSIGSSRQYIRITAATGCAPTLTTAAVVLTLPTGTSYIEVVGSSVATPITLATTAGTATSVVSAVSACAFQCVHFANGSGGMAITPPVTAPVSFTDCTFSGSMGSLVYATTVTALTLARCDFSGAAWSTGLIRANNLGLTMDRCWVGGAAMLLSSYGGVPTVVLSPWVITNCIFIASANAPDAASYLPLFSETAAATVQGCTFYTPAAGTRSAIKTGATRANTHINSNGFVGWLCAIKASNSITITNNGFYGNATATEAPVTNAAAQTTDPLLDAVYKPAVGSPWINQGTTAGLTTDYLGISRPQSGTYDIGAYEYVRIPPNLIAASPSGTAAITVTFDLSVTGSDLTTAAAWSVVNPTESTPDATVLTVSCADGINATLTTTALAPDTVYRVTCPATLIHGAGNTIGNRSVDLVTPSFPQLESADPFAFGVDGLSIDLGSGVYQAVPWAAAAATVTLRDACVISLFTDRRVADAPSHAVPGAVPDVGGWWGDRYNADLAPMGSKLWTIAREGVTNETPRQVEEAAAEALAWLVDVGLAARVDVSAERLGAAGIVLAVVVAKTDGTTEALRFDDLWAR